MIILATLQGRGGGSLCQNGNNKCRRVPWIWKVKVETTIMTFECRKSLYALVLCYFSFKNSLMDINHKMYMFIEFGFSDLMPGNEREVCACLSHINVLRINKSMHRPCACNTQINGFHFTVRKVYSRPIYSLLVKLSQCLHHIMDHTVIF